MKRTVLFFLFLPIMMSVMSSCNDGKAELKYEKYELANGLQVVLHQDVSDPIVSVAILYHVGSNREKPGKTGFAHFFEHMLFQRSEHLPRNTFFQKIDGLGGSFNGFTSNDITTYFETVPRNALEKVLWMESDRLGFFINTVTEGGLRREIDVVSNEKRQGENRPYGLAWDLMFKNMFPQGHPYSWTVIGEIPDLRSATVEDVKEFYDKFYSPGNATLVIAGDFSVPETKALVEKYFGEIPARPEPEAPKVQNVILAETKRIYHEDSFANAPMFIAAYPGVEQFNKDGYALDCLTNILAGDKKSPMYNVLVEERKLLPDVSMFNYQMELSGVLVINATTFPGVKLDDVYAGIQEAYARFEKDGVNPKDIERYLAMTETQLYNRLTSINKKAIEMAVSNNFTGQPDFMLKDLDHYRAVTPADVMRVYEKYIKGKNSLDISMVPAGQTDLILSGSVKAEVDQESIEDQELNSEAGTVVDDPYEFTESAFDRSIEPPLLPNTPELNIPQIWKGKLTNGMEIHGIAYTELPLVNFAIQLNNGQLLDTPQKAGLARLTAAMLNEGTVNKTAAELEEAIGQLGASINVHCNTETMMLAGNCLRKDWNEVLALVEEMLTQPRWDSARFEVVKERTLDNIRQNATEPSEIASTVFKKVIFGRESILGYNVDGTEETLSALTLDDVKKFYLANLSPSIAKMSFVGGLDRKTVEKSLVSLDRNWRPVSIPAPLVTENREKPAAKLYFVDFPGSRQSYIIVGGKAASAISPEAYPATVVNERLGGSTSSQLFEILRLQRGYTYGAYSRFSQGLFASNFMAQSSVQATVTKESVELFRDIITGYQDFYTQEIHETNVSSLLLTMNGSFEVPSALLGMLRYISTYGMPEDYPKQREQILKTMTWAEAREHIAKNLNFDDMVIVVVGDAVSQLAAVKGLNVGPMVQVDKEAKPVTAL